MQTAKQAKAYPELTVISMCPGHLQTGTSGRAIFECLLLTVRCVCCVALGGSNAPMPASVGVEGVLKVVASLTSQDTGKFINFKGEPVQW